MADHWTLDASDGELLVRTDVEGPAARMGHRLTAAMKTWRATVTEADGQPTSVELVVDVDSLEVRKGEGGVTPLLKPEKGIVRSHALKSLEVKRFPEIRFSADDVAKTEDGYRLAGTLEIRGTARERVVDVGVDDLGQSWRLTCEADIRHSDYGIKRPSMLMGAMKVADTVTMYFTATRPKDE